MALNVAEEVLGGVLQAAEQLQGAVLAAESGCVESLRWAGALPLLLRDLGVQGVLQAEQLLSCASAAALRRLLRVEDAQSVGHVVLLLSGFLWDYEAALRRLLALGVVQRLTVCSSLSERAHECFDFGQTAGSKAMNFEELAAQLSRGIEFPVDDEEWGWEDADAQKQTQSGVHVIHLPLNVVPLLSAKTFTPEPSVFVLSHPTCAAAFPLLLHQVKDVKVTTPASPTGRGSADGGKKYTHVKDVLPEHIPSAFRRSMRLLAYTLAEMMVGARLDVKERIFAVGATSLKIGHTLLRILNEMQEDVDAQELQGRQNASMVIIDRYDQDDVCFRHGVCGLIVFYVSVRGRTSDLATPCSFGSSLLDRILALLPQNPVPAAGQDTAEAKNLNVTEIFPLHGCEPTPLSVSALLTSTLDESGYSASEFVSQIQWKGGASLCHPTIPSGSNVFRSLAFRPAKLALRDLDKRLQAVEQTLLQQGKIQKSAVTRRPGEKTRGRDVVLRRISKILEAGEPTNLEFSSLVELGVIVLETLERMDLSQKRWEKCRERAVRHLDLRKQGGREWIIPEVADVMQRQLSAIQSGSTALNEEIVSLQELLTLLVNGFALSSGVPLEDFTVQMVKNALVETILQLFNRLSPFISSDGSQAGHTEQGAAEGDDWDWNDGSTSLTGAPCVHNGDLQLIEVKSIIETYVESLMDPLKVLIFGSICNK
ncbi:unnamed protein product [Phytophthora lilii]|uniref:Unnamed protein product n=1 Tax=Phytophthora lilii TaxID=2077276 RepID=A0A9W6TQD5_9STRA|nr:unnamed protein product [Phytophthora lilii]